MFALKQPDIPKVSNNNSTSSVSTTGFPSYLKKSPPELTNPFATYVDIETLTGYAKHKYLKSSLVNLSQSYLRVVIDQDKKDLNYQFTCKEKLSKIIQSLRAADENATIVNCADYAVKIQDNCAVLAEDSLTNSTQLPHSLMKTQQFFHRGKPRPHGENNTPICTSCTQLRCKASFAI